MFFTHTARVVALLVLLFGLLQAVLGFSIASGWLGPRDAAIARYFPGGATGEMIDSGLLKVAFAVALGTLAEIGLALHRPKDGR